MVTEQSGFKYAPLLTATGDDYTVRVEALHHAIQFLAKAQLARKNGLSNVQAVLLQNARRELEQALE